MANQESVSGIETLSYLNQQDSIKPILIKAQRAPTSRDRRYKVGTFWIDQPGNTTYQLTSVVANVPFWEVLGGGSSDLQKLTGDTGGQILPVSGNINLLGGDLLSVDGSGNSLTLNTTSGGYPISSFVVGISGEAGYQNVQAGLDAANSAGGGVVYVKPGTYTENLTFYPDTEVIGATGTPELSQVIIDGVHIPSATNFCGFTNVTLQSATDIFNSADANTSTIVCQSCLLDVTNGYVFNLPNWGGQATINDSRAIGTDDGVLNNPTGTLSLFTKNSLVGAGSTNTLTTVNNYRLEFTEFVCPISIGGASAGEINLCVFKNTLAFSGTSSSNIFSAFFDTGANVALTQGSSGTIQLQTSSIDSTNDPAISGAGAGVLTLDGVDFINNSNIAGTLTLATGATRSGEFIATVPGDGISIAEGTNARSGIATLVAGTVTVNTTVVTANSRIQLTHQNNAGTPDFVSVTARVAATSFTITSANAGDTSDIAWLIIEPA